MNLNFLHVQIILDEATDFWGVKVERIDIKNVRLPLQLQRAMAAEAQASREARAKILEATGEQKASSALADAAQVIYSVPMAMQLRYLQTLNSVSSKNSWTIIFPFPNEVFESLVDDTNFNVKSV